MRAKTHNEPSDEYRRFWELTGVNNKNAEAHREKSQMPNARSTSDL
jgi:hypothetical protein